MGTIAINIIHNRELLQDNGSNVLTVFYSYSYSVVFCGFPVQTNNRQNGLVFVSHYMIYVWLSLSYSIIFDHDVLS